MKKFRIPVSWSVAAVLTVEAQDLETALSYAKESPLPDEYEYVDGSFKVDSYLIDEFPDDYGEMKTGETNRVCRRCKSPVHYSDNPEYKYQCFQCEEDLYEFEADLKEGDSN